MALVARTAADPTRRATSLRQAVRAADPSLPLFEVQTMDAAVGTWGAGARFSTWLLSLLAAIGLLLAAIAIYGVTAYFVTQRTAEIGLPLALGASRRDVLLMVLRHGTALAPGGVGVGLPGAFGLTRAVSALLFEVTPTNAPSYAIGSAALFTIALIACLVPALRAVRVDPMRSLTDT